MNRWTKYCYFILLIVISSDPQLIYAQSLAKSASRQKRRTPVVEVFQAARGAVVNISSTQIIEYQTRSGGLESLFGQFFQLPRPRYRRRYKSTSVGSGFVLHPSGYIVTNAHVVARTAERKVIFNDGREFEAQLVAIDTMRDLAVLKINAPKPLPILPLGHSNDLMVGETVIAIGNPFGFQNTVTSGVISALNRSMEFQQGVSLKGLIQTDASINPGNSGGPLLNVLGELVGINTAIRADAQNIGFAIAVDQLRSTLPELLDVERRYHIRMGLRLSRDDRLRVVSVNVDSPADQAGVELGDVLVAVNGTALLAAVDYDIALIGKKPGDAIHLTLKHKQQIKQITAILKERPRPDGAKLLEQLLGIEAGTITSKMLKGTGIRNLRGIIVTHVANQSPAKQAGLARGDIINHIARHPVANLQEVGELLERVEHGQKILVGVIRIQGRSTYRATITLKTK